MAFLQGVNEWEASLTCSAPGHPLGHSIGMELSHLLDVLFHVTGYRGDEFAVLELVMVLLADAALCH
jgi:hypothetical protein